MKSKFVKFWLIVTICSFFLLMINGCSLSAYLNNLVTLDLLELEDSLGIMLNTLVFDVYSWQNETLNASRDLDFDHVKKLSFAVNLASNETFYLLLIPSLIVNSQRFELAAWGAVWPWGQEDQTKRQVSLSKEAGLAASLVFSLARLSISHKDLNNAKLLSEILKKDLNTVNCDSKLALEALAQRSMSVYKLKKRQIPDNVPMNLVEGFGDAAGGFPAQLYLGWNLLVASEALLKLRLVQVDLDAAGTWQFDYLDLTSRLLPSLQFYPQQLSPLLSFSPQGELQLSHL